MPKIPPVIITIDTDLSLKSDKYSVTDDGPGSPFSEEFYDKPDYAEREAEARQAYFLAKGLTVQSRFERTQGGDE